MSNAAGIGPGISSTRGPRSSGVPGQTGPYHRRRSTVRSMRRDGDRARPGNAAGRCESAQAARIHAQRERLRCRGGASNSRRNSAGPAALGASRWLHRDRGRAGRSSRPQPGPRRRSSYRRGSELGKKKRLSCNRGHAHGRPRHSSVLGSTRFWAFDSQYISRGDRGQGARSSQIDRGSRAAGSAGPRGLGRRRGSSGPNI